MQNNPSPNRYDGANIVFVLTPFNITPSRCRISYACTNVDYSETAQGMQCSDFNDGLNLDATLTISFTIQDYLTDVPPQVYTVTITGTATKSGLTQTTTFAITLEDICDPPVIVSRPVIDNQEFTIADKSEPTFTHPSFTVIPPICPLTYTYTATELVEPAVANTAIKAYDAVT